MFAFLNFFLLLIEWIPLYQAQYPFATEIHYLKYGDLFNVKDKFLPTDGKRVDKPPDPNLTVVKALSDSYMLYDADEVLDDFNTTGSVGRDENQFNQINLQILNLTRNTRKRQFIWSWYWYDPTDPNYIKTQDSDKAEAVKRKRLVDIGLTFLIHSRYLVDGAMKQRSMIRQDKRYKMGYLFNRMRRLKTEMLKMIRMGHESNSIYWTKRIMIVMRIYEEVIQMDMDIRDVAWEINELGEKLEPYDYGVNESVSHPGFGPHGPGSPGGGLPPGAMGKGGPPNMG